MNLAYKKTIIIIVAVLVVVIVGVIAMTYLVRVNSPAITSVREILHLPAITVDGTNISISEIDKNTESIRQFYENQDFSKLGIRIDFETEDGQKRLKIEQRKMINKLIEDIAIAKLAKEWGITVSDDAVESAMKRPMDEMGTEEEVKQKLQELYGWSLDDFAKKVVYKQLLKERVSDYFLENNSISDEKKQKIEQAKKELDDNRAFADVAQKYSEGVNAQNGGVMGWFASEQMQDELGKKIFSMEKGQYTDIMETPIGLHIVRVNDVTEVDGQKMVHVSQIVIKRRTLVDYLTDKIKNMNVKIFIPGYRWDAETGMVVFDSEEMQQFEQDVIKEAEEAQQKALEEAETTKQGDAQDTQQE